MQRKNEARGLHPVWVMLLVLAWGAAAFADPVPTARERAAARSRANHRQALAARDARDTASIAEAEAYRDGVRADSADAIEAGKQDIYDYAREHRPESGFREEIIVQETWRYDPELGDHVLDWQYHLAYLDSFNVTQYEAYFDQQGNLTTPFRESPWRIAQRWAREALRDETDGPFNIAWDVDTDNLGREYPSRVIIQGDGVNRVRASFNQDGNAWFWDIKNEDGDPVAYGQGTDKPQYTDPEGALANVTPPRPGTGPCRDPDCRSQLDERNEIVGEMATLAAQINEMADTHGRLDEVAAAGQHVDTRYQRQRHGALLPRYEALVPVYETAHAAWMACEALCKKAGGEPENLVSMGSDVAATGAAASGGLSAIAFQALLDSGLPCHFGNFGSPLVATPVDPGGLGAAPGTGPATTTDQAGGTGPGGTALGGPASTATSGGPATTSGGPGSTTGGAPTSTTQASGLATTPEGGSTTATGTPSASSTPAGTAVPGSKASPTAQTSTSTDKTSTSTDKTSTSTAQASESATGLTSGGGTGTPTSGDSTSRTPPPSTTDDDEDSGDPRDTAPPDSSQPADIPAGSVVLLVKSSSAASVEGTSSVLLVVPPAAADAFALPSNDCGASSCDTWKFDDSCSEQWFCDQATPADASCTGSACDVAIEDCSGGGCTFTSDCDPGVICDDGDESECTDESCLSPDENACVGADCEVAMSSCTGSGCTENAVGWTAECSDGGCDYVVEDATCSAPPCELTCNESSCGVDVGFDQGPVKCEVGSDDSCSIIISPSQLEAGKYFLYVDPQLGSSLPFEDLALGATGFLALNESQEFEVAVEAPDYNGYTLRIDPTVFDIPSALAPYYYAGVDILGKTYANLLFPTALQGTVDDALFELPGLFSTLIDPCFIMWGGPNDPYYRSTGSWGQDHADQWALHRVGFPPEGVNAWDLAGDDLEDVIVAVIDTGIDWNHRDFAWQNLWFNDAETAGNGLDDDGNGFADDRIGWDFWDRDGRPWDENGHGTVVSGIIAARGGNGQGIAGVNPHARIMPLRVMNAFGHTRASFLARALVYAVDNGARVVNVSLGGAGESEMLVDALDYAEQKGVLVVAAAGNEATALEGILPGIHPTTLTVASSDFEDRRAIFSNHGAAVDVAAPGLDVLSLRARFTDTMLGIPGVAYEAGQAWVGADTRYYRVGGTSFSAPLVTGIASLLLSRDPSLRAPDLRRILTNSARDIDLPGIDLHTGYGIVDARAALRADRSHFVEARIDSLSVAQGASGPEIVVTGSANADRLDYAEISLGAGEAPTSWRALPRLDAPVASARLGAIPTGWVAGSKVWAVRLAVVHADGSLRETRYRLQLE